MRSLPERSGPSSTTLYISDGDPKSTRVLLGVLRAIRSERSVFEVRANPQGRARFAYEGREPHEAPVLQSS